VRVVIAGSGGLIGSALVLALEEAGHRVQTLVRPGSVRAAGIRWDPGSGRLDPTVLEGAEAVVNLGGRSIGERRWDEEEKALIRESRVGPTRLLAEAIAGLTYPPRVLLNASAVGIYGDRPGERLTEASLPGEGFFAGVCRDWEEATRPAAAAGVRVVCLRSGLVLAREGGALGRLLAPLGPRWLSPYRWGLGGWLGDGTQMWSWIALEDEVRAILHLLTSDLTGPVNLTAPDPAPNKRFVKAVGRALGRPVWLPIPRFVPRLLLGRSLADSTLFDSQAVYPERLQADGFRFAEPHLEDALGTALAR
jgi:uncharacterized protein (TIGR01777 family)